MGAADLELGRVLTPEGWAYASTAPIDASDRGRYRALFGRDSLITALQVLPAQPEVARSTLRTLASLQGSHEDPATDEQPGRILHEYWPVAPAWMASAGWPVRGGALRYYGSSDSTPWFLVVLASLGDGRLAAELEPAWRAAGEWLHGALAGGGGLVRHGPRREKGGLVQQGWRDLSESDPDPGAGIVHPDGSRPTHPLADADTQAVALVALRALFALSGDTRWKVAARALAERIDAGFGPETMALDAGDREVAGAGSQLGWLLWAGALSPARAEAAADRLAESDVLTDFGLRTLSERHPAYAPDAYHRGSVWPFDSWLGWGGLRAAGREADAERLRAGVLAAIERLGHAPELYAVGGDGPRRIASANAVQAWTIGARWALQNAWDGRHPKLFPPAASTQAFNELRPQSKRGAIAHG